MKKIGKINLANKDLLSDGEMKRVLGGESSSTWCKTGEFLFHCKADLTGNYSNTFDVGGVCASSPDAARRMVLETLKAQDRIDGGSVGSYAAYCS